MSAIQKTVLETIFFQEDQLEPIRLPAKKKKKNKTSSGRLRFVECNFGFFGQPKTAMNIVSDRDPNFR